MTQTLARQVEEAITAGRAKIAEAGHKYTWATSDRQVRQAERLAQEGMAEVTAEEEETRTETCIACGEEYESDMRSDRCPRCDERHFAGDEDEDEA